ncbi:ERF family protein [Streptomyces sp. NPDC088707]|uniref:ERF family protein n=1 Tax=Streptomyces sp. NPDC088707 TaxID=3365871 RepID=UPI00381117AF
MADMTSVADDATEIPPLSVDEAMIAVMREIGPVGKNGRNKDQNYAFRAQEDIVAAARGPMARHGLRMLPKIVGHEHFVRGKMNVAVIEVEYTFRGPSGDTMPPILVIGEGADPSDKASNKAMTAAMKYAMIQSFQIGDGADDGDRDHPAAIRGPLDWYIEQIQDSKIWYNAEALRKLRDKAIDQGVADLQMPDEPLTFRQVVEQQGRKLLAEQQEKVQRRAEEAGAAHAQLLAEHPDPPTHYEDEWSQATPARQAPPQATRRPAPPPPAAPQPDPLPDAARVQHEYAKAVANPTYGQQALHDMRSHYGVGPLAQTSIATERFGTVDANSAITMALMDWEEIARAHMSPTPAPSAPQPPAADTIPAAFPLRLAPETSDTSERARGRLIAEAQMQAQFLGIDTLEYVADLLPPGATDIEQVAGGSRLMNLVSEHRPQVVAAFTQAGMTQAAAAYAAFGTRVPAPGINKFLADILKVT